MVLQPKQQTPSATNEAVANSASNTNATSANATKKIKETPVATTEAVLEVTRQLLSSLKELVTVTVT